MGFAGTFGAKLNQIVIPFYKGDEAQQLKKLTSLSKKVWIEPNALHQQVNPLIRRKCLPGAQIGVEVELR